MRTVGIESIRRRQLIDATLAVIEKEGFQGATVGRISKASGMSVGIISHYFDGKQGLLQATMRHLLSLLKTDLLDLLSEHGNDPVARLHAIVASNFSRSQTNMAVAKAWLAFWAQAMHSPELARLQRINERRLYSNLVFSLVQLMPDKQARETAQTIAALIDGVWLRAALSEGRIESKEAVALCVRYLDQTLSAQKTVSPQKQSQRSQENREEAQ